MSGNEPGKLQGLVATAPPWWLRNRYIGAFLEAWAVVQDSAIESLGQALRFAHPLRCHPSALPHLSRDRRIRIYPTEPIDSKRQRLADWWNLHRQRGTHQGELRNLLPYFLPAAPLMRIVHQNGDGTRATWHTLSESGTYSIRKTEPSNWNWDGKTTEWSRWWAIIYYETALNWLEPAEYDDGTTWDDGTLWDGGPSTAQIADIVGALKEAQGAHSRLQGVIVTRELLSFSPNGTAVTDPDGWTSLPVGNWAAAIDHVTGLPSRPPYMSLIYNAGAIAA